MNGRVVVRQGQLTTLKLRPLIEQHHQFARQLANSVFKKYCVFYSYKPLLHKG